MVGALRLAWLLAQPMVADASPVHGVVLRQDGSKAQDAVVEVTCGAWEQQTTTDALGGFRFADAPSGRCTIRIHVAEEPGAGVTMDVPIDRTEPLSVIIPVGLGLRTPTPRSPGFTFDLTTDKASVTRLPWLGAATTLTGTGSWASGHATGSAVLAFDPRPKGVGPTARPDQWSVGMTATRPGPWGTLFSGTVTARRQVEPNTLLGDVTGMPPPSASSWSLMFDPTRSTMVWDTRFRLERTVTAWGADLTFFGEAYKSFQGASQGNGALIPLPEEATQGLRAGTAARFGLRVGF